MRYNQIMRPRAGLSAHAAGFCILSLLLFLANILVAQPGHLGLANTVPEAGSRSDERSSKRPENQNKPSGPRRDSSQKKWRETLQNLQMIQDFTAPYELSFTAQKSERHTWEKLSDHSSYGVLLEPQPGRSLRDGKKLFMRGDYWQASQIIMENRYTQQAVQDPYYFNWLLKSLLAARRLQLIPQYLKPYRLQLGILRTSADARDAELYYLLGRYYFALGDMRQTRAILVDYLRQFPGGDYIPNCYYWIARSLERDNYLPQARAVYLLVVSYYEQHHLNNLARYKAGVISLHLLKQQAEKFLHSRGVDLPL